MSRLTSTSIHPNGANRSSIFVATSHDKRNLWWKAFRKTVLEPHSMIFEEDPITGEVPPDLLWIAEEKCQNLERYENQALEFREAVWQGRGFGPSPIFPPDIVPPVNTKAFLSRCMEPSMAQETLPPPELSLRIPLFELPTPRPGLACGFMAGAFSDAEFKELPVCLTATGTISDYSTGQILPGQAVYCPFLSFERAYGHAKHEIEFAMNYCAINGCAGLNAIKMLYDRAWITNSSNRPSSPVTFSCIIDDDLGIINHHWIDEDDLYHVAPLCKFDFREMEHFMHFLAWIEAIEEWAAGSLLSDIRRALQVIIEQKTAGLGSPRALPTPVTDAEKEQKLSRAMRTAFENLPWKGERSRTTPLAVTAAMRMRSPRSAPIPENEASAIPSAFQQDISEPGDTQMTDVSAAASLLPAKSPDMRPARSFGPASQVPTVPDLHGSQAFTSTTPAAANITIERSKTLAAHISHSSVAAVESRNGHATENSCTTVDNLQNSKTPITATRPMTAADPDTCRSPPLTTRPTTATISENNKSPGMFWSTISMKSPAQSVSSIQSKRSFLSLRKEKRIRSPQTPEFGRSPRGVAFVSKLSNGLDVIKEHARPKRARMDNEGPQSAKSTPIPISMPTPAYDKRYFERRTMDLPNASPKPVGATGPSNTVGGNTSSNVIISEQTVQNAANTSKLLQLPAKKVISKPPQPRINTLVESNLKADNSIFISPVTKSDHTLPLRNWSETPVAATTTIATRPEQQVSVSAWG